MIPERKKMGRKTQTEKPQKITAAVQTARGGGHPFGVIDRHRPLTRPEFAVYDAIREAVPIVDAAIGKIIRLIGGFTVKCGDKEAENGVVAVRSRKEGDLGAMTPGAFIEKAAEEIRTKAR